jgi:hypothetical protein
MQSMRQSGSASTLRTGIGALPLLSYDSSVPQLGIRRMDAFTKKRNESLMMPSSPQNDQDKRDADLKTKIDAASKRVWERLCGDFTIRQEVSRLALEGTKGVKALAGMKGFIPPTVKEFIGGYGGADLNWRNPEWDGMTMLLKAVCQGYLETVMWLLSRDGDHLAVDNSGRGIFHWAAIQGHTKIMDFLLTARPPEVEKNEVLREPQSFSVSFFQDDWPEKTSYSRDPAIIQSVLNVPDATAADMAKTEHVVFPADNGGDTPLHLACYAGHLKIVRLLVSAKADVYLKNANGFTPLDLAVARKHPWPGEEAPPPIYKSRTNRPEPPGRSVGLARYLREQTDVKADLSYATAAEDENFEDLGLARLWRPADLVRIAELKKEDDPRSEWTQPELSTIGLKMVKVPDPADIDGLRKDVQRRLKSHASKLAAPKT